MGGHERLGIEGLALLLGAENPDKRTIVAAVATGPIVAENRRPDFEYHPWTFLAVQYSIVAFENVWSAN